jgi:hypothetical protein
MPAGWIAIHRTIRNHHIVGYGKPVKPCDPSRGAYSRNEAWSDLLMECRYADGKVTNGGREMELRRGELVGAISWLAARWNWTPKTVRGFIDALEADGAISVRAPGAIQGQQKGKQAHVITVCNYEKYQSAPDEEGQAKGHDLGTQRASKGQATGNIERKDNKDNNSYWGKRERTPEEIAEADRSAAEAYQRGLEIKGGSVAKSGRTAVVTTGELDGSRGIAFRDGKLAIVNGTAAMFSDEFPGLDIAAVCNKAGPEIARQKYPTYEFACSVVRKWAQIQVENKSIKPQGETAAERRARLLAQIRDEEGRR